jgi:hypothetical protein
MIHKICVPNGPKIDQMSIKYIPTSSIVRPSKSYPNKDFWYENMPSGNPGEANESRLSPEWPDWAKFRHLAIV